MNLLINAAHAIDKNGRILIKTWADPEQVYISISDNGCGIPQENISRIFDPFFTTKPVGKGTGLGLSISKRLIELMNGKIAFKSKEGVGTVFQVTVPLEKVVHSTFAEEAPKDVEYKASTYYTRAELLKLKGQLPSQKVDDINTNSPAAPINQAQHKKVLIVDDVHQSLVHGLIEANFDVHYRPDLQGNEIVYDLYTGTGTIGLFLAKHATKVVGLEYVEMAVEDARINAITASNASSALRYPRKICARRSFSSAGTS